MSLNARLASAPPAVQHAALLQIVADSPLMMTTLTGLRDWGLPDGWLVAGAIYGTVWNALTGRPPLHGIKDIDLFYFDPDLSAEAETAVQIEAARRFPGPPRIDIRNQARVHLWFEGRFGFPYPALTHSCEAVDRFAIRTHCVALRLTDALQLYAPYGLDDLFCLRLTPNPVLPNRSTFEEKSARQQAHWPELTLTPWPATKVPSLREKYSL